VHNTCVPDKPEVLATDALDPKKFSDVEKAIAQLTPDEAEKFIVLIERALKRRKIQFAGYMVSLVVLIGTMVGAMLIVGNAAQGTFIAWVFLVPFLLVAVLFLGFGRWANRYK